MCQNELLPVGIFIVVTHGSTILAGHPAYSILLALVALVALGVLAVAVLRGSRI